MPNQITVPFHGSNLLIIEHNDQPYTPMKVIVENMGLAWQAQFWLDYESKDVID